MHSRGHHLMRSGLLFANGGGLLGRLFGSGVEWLLDLLDERIAEGGIEATLPDGARRRIGFHAPGPTAVVTLNSWYALVRLATSGSIGWYRAWAKGEWRSPDPVVLFELFMRNASNLGDAARAKGSVRLLNLFRHRLRDNGPLRARDNIAAHYDLGNDFYRAWLDPTMTYSSALFDRGGNLEAGQRRKVQTLLDRLELKPGERLLELGCGWGSLAIEAARRGAQVVGLTLSTEQQEWARAAVRDAGVEDRVDIRLQDYREIDERFDRVASVEMVEAVGQRWWPAYLDCIARSLGPGGSAALQLISIRHELFADYAASADFIQAYIFPGGCLIDEPRFAALAAERGLDWRDRHGFGLDYAETLRQWRERYDAAVAAGRLQGFSAEFHDLWRYYLMYCEGGFRGEGIDVAQVTLVKA
ncbi:MAG TPA: cyclopropane-fatty-acyl-phospholipid synthase family protein [Beijerinckiaceae bacterium]|nr:cyclopropane-fatty-acyl-phospholipid synthase family protein [Beijerinckiaceae bacterium]